MPDATHPRPRFRGGKMGLASQVMRFKSPILRERCNVTSGESQQDARGGFPRALHFHHDPRSPYLG